MARGLREPMPAFFLLASLAFALGCCSVGRWLSMVRLSKLTSTPWSPLPSGRDNRDTYSCVLMQPTRVVPALAGRAGRVLEREMFPLLRMPRRSFVVQL